MKVALVLTTILVAACGSDSSTPTQKDAAGSGSNTANTVAAVSCTGATVASTVTTDDATMKYTISNASIPAGSIVHFTTSVTHDVNPSPEQTTPTVVHSDPGIKVGFSGDACLKFSTAGAFTFYCSRHGFKGTITVN